MSTNKPGILFYTTAETKRKLKIVAEKDGRSMSNYIEHLIEKAIREYEKQNGEI